MDLQPLATCNESEGGKCGRRAKAKATEAENELMVSRTMPSCKVAGSILFAWVWLGGTRALLLWQRAACRAACRTEAEGEGWLR